MRSFFERAAINAPIQGTAADIIRRAMVRMPDALAEAGVRRGCCCRCTTNWCSRRRMREVEATIKLAAKVMERGGEPAVALSVPLKVDARAAGNWDEAH